MAIRIPNTDFPTARGNINDQLDLIAQLGAADSEPSNPEPYESWFDTNNNEWKIRNSANTDWIVLGDPTVQYLGIAVPSGTLAPTLRATAPNGWLLCQGQTLDTTSYENLFAAIGYTFGGSGSSFDLPDLRGLTVLGAGESAASGTDRSVGATGGSDEHTLTDAEMPSHNHGGNTTITNINHQHTGTTATDGNHIHPFNDRDNTATGGSAERIATGAGDGSAFSAAAGDHNHSFTTNSMNQNTTHNHTIPVDGSDSAHNNLQPYIALHWMVKI